MKSEKLLFLFACIFIVVLDSCKKDDNSNPVLPPLQDTVGASQFVMCKIDSISFVSATKADREDTIKILQNTLTFTDFYASSKVLRNGRQLIRNLTITLNDFQTMGVATYIGGQMFAKSRTDVLSNGSNVDNLLWAKFDTPTNKITITSQTDSITRGTFNFRLQSEPGAAQKIEVVNGIFKIRTH